MPQRLMTCDACGRGEWHESNSPRARPMGRKCSCGFAYDDALPKRTRVFSIGNKPWGDEGRSLMYAFDPSAIAEIGQTCPMTARAIDPTDGTVVFENDSHQKAVYTEWTHDIERNKQQDDAEKAANLRRFLNADHPDQPESDEHDAGLIEPASAE